MLDAITTTFARWRDEATTPEARASLDEACERAEASLDDACDRPDHSRIEPLSFRPTGVAACDDFARDYARCIDGLPESVRELSRGALTTSVEAWQKVAEYPPNADKLGAACLQARAAVSESCGW